MGNGDVDQVVTAVARSVHAALTSEAGLAPDDAQTLAREVGTEVRKAFLRPGPLRGTLLYAVTAAGPHGRPDWLRVGPDSRVADIDAALGAGNWLVLDAAGHIEAACTPIAEADPQFAIWRAHQLAAGN